MAITLNLKNLVDQPVWEWCKLAPVATNTNICATCSPPGAPRYMYYYTAATMYRYDTINDTWHQLANGPVTAAVDAPLRYSNDVGYYSRVLASPAPTTTTFYAAALNGKALKGLKIKILSGTGAGQERTILDVGEPITYDYGVATAGATTSLTDATVNPPIYRLWKPNQWRDYQVRVVLGTGQSQVRRILYNTSTVLTVADPAYLAIDPWGNPPWTAPGAGSDYYIEASMITVSVAWDVTPDATSRFVVKGGGIWLLNSAAAPWLSLSYYDVISDYWHVKSVQYNFLNAAATDLATEIVHDGPSALITGVTATSGTSRRLVNSGANMVINQYAGMQLRITASTTAASIGQYRTIIANDATSFTIGKSWLSNPANGDGYEVWPDTDKIWSTYATHSAMQQYGIDADHWTTGTQLDWGICRAISLSAPGQTGDRAHGVAAGGVVVSAGGLVGNTGGTQPVTIAAGGSGYFIGNILTVNGGGGTTAKYRVTGVDSVGAVTSIALENAGTAYNTTGSTIVTTVLPAGGTGCTVSWASGATTNVAAVTTILSTNFLIGDSVTVAGALAPAAINGAWPVVGYDTALIFRLSVGATATGTATVTQAQTTLIIVDATKNWAPSELVGKLVSIQIGAGGYVRRISANTSTTFTMGTLVLGASPVDGTTRYMIQDMKPFGVDSTLPKTSYFPPGATSGTPNQGTWGDCTSTAGDAKTIIDATKNWPVNWFNQTLQTIVSASDATIQVSNSTTITDSSSRLAVFTVGMWIKLSGFSQSGNNSWFQVVTSAAGTLTVASGLTTESGSVIRTIKGTDARLVQIVAGAGAGSQAAILSNTATTLTLATALSATTDATTVYEILDCYGVATGGSTTAIIDYTQNWPYAYFAGHRARMLAGQVPGTANPAEQAVVAAGQNSQTQMSAFGTSFGFTIGATAGADVYAIYPITPRGTGLHLDRLYDPSTSNMKARFMYSFRGGAATELNRYDIPYGVWETITQFPNMETLTTGSMYSYDGVDRIYFTKEATGRINYYDIVTNLVMPSATVPYGMGTAVIGNRMEIIEYADPTASSYPKDHLRYLYVMRHTGNEMWRVLLWW